MIEKYKECRVMSVEWRENFPSLDTRPSTLVSDFELRISDFK